MKNLKRLFWASCACCLLCFTSTHAQTTSYLNSVNVSAYYVSLGSVPNPASDTTSGTPGTLPVIVSPWAGRWVILVHPARILPSASGVRKDKNQSGLQ